MYEEVLKYGSLIVDALRSYSHPVFIYLPPNGELRGGAWVVVDPTINISQIEMFADPESRWELEHFVTFILETELQESPIELTPVIPYMVT